MAREGQICSTNCKSSRICPNQCDTTIFFFSFLESLGKFRNCHRAVLKNLLYFWPKFNGLGLVGQICPSLARLGLSLHMIWVYKCVGLNKLSPGKKKCAKHTPDHLRKVRMKDNFLEVI